MIYNPEQDTIHIIEMNPRMASQYADLFEKVDGVNTYQLLLDLVTGTCPKFTKGRGTYSYSASCVLRLFEDRYVTRVPSEYDVQKLYEQFPNTRFELCCQAGKNLSDVLQDGKSFRYGLVHVAANTRDGLVDMFKECKKLLPFTFESIGPRSV